MDNANVQNQRLENVEEEIRFCMNIIEHNKRLDEILQKAAPSLRIARNVSLTKKKFTAIIKNIINRSLIFETAEILQNKFFSVTIIEWEGKSDTNIVYFLVRYVHNEKIYTHLLDLYRVIKHTSENTYKCLIYALQKHNLCVHNIIGVCIDNANMMLAQQKALVTQLLSDNPEVSMFPCIYYSMHYVVSDSCECLPSNVHNFVNEFFLYNSCDDTRQNIIGEMQCFMESEMGQVLQPYQIPWIVIPQIIRKMLDQWDVFLAVFEEEAINENSKIVQEILKSFNCPYTMAYLQFLDYVLNIVGTFNTLFQSSNVLLHRLLPECFRFLRLIGANFMKVQTIRAPNLHEVNVYNKDNLLPLQRIYIGSEAATTIQNIRNSEVKNDELIVQFYKSVKAFYQSIFNNSVARLPFSEEFLNSLNFLTPEVALSVTHPRDQLSSILNKFESKLNSGNVCNEWHLLPFYFSEEEIQDLETLDIVQFWNKVSNVKDISDKIVFENVANVAELCLSLPLSNADIRRFFSIFIESTTRENISHPETLAVICRFKFDLQNKNVNSMNYEITDKMLSLYNNDMCKKETIPEEFSKIVLLDKFEPSDSDD